VLFSRSVLFDRVYVYSIGRNIKLLIDRPDGVSTQITHPPIHIFCLFFTQLFTPRQPLTCSSVSLSHTHTVCICSRTLFCLPPQEYCFRLQNDRVYYLSANLVSLSASFPRDTLHSAGTCFGKFTKTRQFRLHVTALDYLAQYAKYKLWVRPSAELSFLYGNNILKAHIGRMTDSVPQYAGVVVLSMSDVALGFGVTGMSTKECRKAESTAVVAFHQADIGEYLRMEDEL